MNVKEFKEAFSDLASGIPATGVNSGQWKKLVSLVEQLEETKAPKQTKIKADAE